MNHYLKVYRTLFFVSLSNLLIYRGNLFNSILSSVGWTLFSLASVLLLTSNATEILGWTREEIVMLTACYSFLVGIFHAMFTRNFQDFSDLMHFGELDIYLTKPIDTQFWVTFKQINFTSLSRSIVGLIIILYLAPRLSIHFSIPLLLGFMILVIVGVIVLYNVWFLAMTLTIRYTRLSNLVELLHTISGIGRYPREIFEASGSFFVIALLPVTLIATTPAKLLFGKISYPDLALLFIFCAGLTIAARKFWLFSLKSYASAGG